MASKEELRKQLESKRQVNTSLQREIVDNNAHLSRLHENTAQLARYSNNSTPQSSSGQSYSNSNTSSPKTPRQQVNVGSQANRSSCQSNTSNSSSSPKVGRPSQFNHTPSQSRQTNQIHPSNHMTAKPHPQLPDNTTSTSMQMQQSRLSFQQQPMMNPAQHQQMNPAAFAHGLQSVTRHQQDSAVSHLSRLQDSPASNAYMTDGPAYQDTPTQNGGDMYQGFYEDMEGEHMATFDEGNDTIEGQTQLDPVTPSNHKGQGGQGHREGSGQGSNGPGDSGNDREERQHQDEEILARLQQLNQERGSLVQQIESEDKNRKWYYDQIEVISRKIRSLPNTETHAVKQPGLTRKHLEFEIERLHEKMQTSFGTNEEIDQRQDSRVHRVREIESELMNLQQKRHHMLLEAEQQEARSRHQSFNDSAHSSHFDESSMSTQTEVDQDMAQVRMTYGQHNVPGAIYHGSWPISDGVPRSQSAGNQGDLASVMSFTSTNTSSSHGSGVAGVKGQGQMGQGQLRSQQQIGPIPLEIPPQQLGTKVEMVYGLLSMLGTHDKDDMSKTLLAMSSSQDSCIAMRQSGCLPLLIQLLHGSDQDSGLLGNTRGSKEARARAAAALHNIVHSHPDDKRGRREARVLRLLEQIRAHCDQLREVMEDEEQESNQLAHSPLDAMDHHPGPAIATLMKLSFDEEHRHAICTLGGLHAIAELLQVDNDLHSDTTEQYNITMRRYACMALTNLTFGDGTNKALLCSMKTSMGALVSQLFNLNEELCQVAASVLRNLSWKADLASKKTLREVGAVTSLMKASMRVQKETTLKSILSALWNLSAHCSENKADICAVRSALEFLISTLTYKSPSKTPAIVENGGGILRNVSSHIAVREDYRVVIRQHGCLQILLKHLRSPSLTIVSNACGTLWNLSARCAEDQQALWEMGAVGMLRNLVHSKHKMISMGSSAALKNLLAARPAMKGAELNKHSNQNRPSLHVRKQRALESEIDQNLAETCENVESPRDSPIESKKQESSHFVYSVYPVVGDGDPRRSMIRGPGPVIPRSHSGDNTLYAGAAENKTNTQGVARSGSQDSVGSTHSDISHDRSRHISGGGKAPPRSHSTMGGSLDRHKEGSVGGGNPRGGHFEGRSERNPLGTPNSRILQVMQEVAMHAGLENQSHGQSHDKDSGSGGGVFKTPFPVTSMRSSQQGQGHMQNQGHSQGQMSASGQMSVSTSSSSSSHHRQPLQVLPPHSMSQNPNYPLPAYLTNSQHNPHTAQQSAQYLQYLMANLPSHSNAGNFNAGNFNMAGLAAAAAGHRVVLPPSNNDHDGGGEDDDGDEKPLDYSMKYQEGRSNMQSQQSHNDGGRFGGQNPGGHGSMAHNRGGGPIVGNFVGNPNHPANMQSNLRGNSGYSHNQQQGSGNGGNSNPYMNQNQKGNQRGVQNGPGTNMGHFPNSAYAETDLDDPDQPTDYSARYGVDYARDQYRDDRRGNYDGQYQETDPNCADCKLEEARRYHDRMDEAIDEDQVRTFCTEDTPYLSTATSLTDLSTGVKILEEADEHCENDEDDQTQNFSSKYGENEGNSEGQGHHNHIHGHQRSNQGQQRSNQGQQRLNEQGQCQSHHQRSLLLLDEGHGSIKGQGQRLYDGEKSSRSGSNMTDIQTGTTVITNYHLKSDRRSQESNSHSSDEMPERSFHDNRNDDAPMDQIKTYCEEGTPVCFSRVSSLSSLHSSEAADRQEKRNPAGGSLSNVGAGNIGGANIGQQGQLQSIDESEDVKMTNSHGGFRQKDENGEIIDTGSEKEHKTVTFDDKEQVQETPMMFSRCTSLGSLSSFDTQSVHSSVFSEYSRRASEVVSPSELPDSPSETMPPSPRRTKSPERHSHHQNQSHGQNGNAMQNNENSSRKANDNSGMLNMNNNGQMNHGGQMNNNQLNHGQMNHGGPQKFSAKMNEGGPQRVNPAAIRQLFGLTDMGMKDIDYETGSCKSEAPVVYADEGTPPVFNDNLSELSCVTSDNYNINDRTLVEGNLSMTPGSSKGQGQNQFIGQGASNAISEGNGGPPRNVQYFNPTSGNAITKGANSMSQNSKNATNYASGNNFQNISDSKGEQFHKDGQFQTISDNSFSQQSAVTHNASLPMKTQTAEEGPKETNEPKGDESDANKPKNGPKDDEKAASSNSDVSEGEDDLLAEVISSAMPISSKKARKSSSENSSRRKSNSNSSKPDSGSSSRSKTPAKSQPQSGSSSKSSSVNSSAKKSLKMSSTKSSNETSPNSKQAAMNVTASSVNERNTGSTSSSSKGKDSLQHKGGESSSGSSSPGKAKSQIPRPMQHRQLAHLQQASQHDCSMDSTRSYGDEDSPFNTSNTQSVIMKPGNASTNNAMVQGNNMVPQGQGQGMAPTAPSPLILQKARNLSNIDADDDNDEGCKTYATEDTPFSGSIPASPRSQRRLVGGGVDNGNNSSMTTNANMATNNVMANNPMATNMANNAVMGNNVFSNNTSIATNMASNNVMANNTIATNMVNNSFSNNAAIATNTIPSIPDGATDTVKSYATEDTPFSGSVPGSPPPTQPRNYANEHDDIDIEQDSVKCFNTEDTPFSGSTFGSPKLGRKQSIEGQGQKAVGGQGEGCVNDVQQSGALNTGSRTNQGQMQNKGQQGQMQNQGQQMQGRQMMPNQMMQNQNQMMQNQNQMMQNQNQAQRMQGQINQGQGQIMQGQGQMNQGQMQFQGQNQFQCKLPMKHPQFNMRMLNQMDYHGNTNFNDDFGDDGNDMVQTFATEGTPQNYSRTGSCSDLSSLNANFDEKVTIDVNNQSTNPTSNPLQNQNQDGDGGMEQGMGGDSDSSVDGNDDLLSDLIQSAMPAPKSVKSRKSIDRKPEGAEDTSIISSTPKTSSKGGKGVNGGLQSKGGNSSISSNGEFANKGKGSNSGVPAHFQPQRTSSQAHPGVAGGVSSVSTNNKGMSQNSQGGFDQPKTYAMEGTPDNLSNATSLSDLTVDSYPSNRPSAKFNNKTSTNDSSSLLPPSQNPASHSQLKSENSLTSGYGQSTTFSMGNDSVFLHSDGGGDSMRVFKMEGTPQSFSCNDSLSSLGFCESEYETEVSRQVKALANTLTGNKTTETENDTKVGKKAESDTKVPNKPEMNTNRTNNAELSSGTKNSSSSKPRQASMNSENTAVGNNTNSKQVVNAQTAKGDSMAMRSGSKTSSSVTSSSNSSSKQSVIEVDKQAVGQSNDGRQAIVGRSCEDQAVTVRNQERMARENSSSMKRGDENLSRGSGENVNEYRGGEKVTEYRVEDTPLSFSRNSSLSSIHDEVEKEQRLIDGQSLTGQTQQEQFSGNGNNNNATTNKHASQDEKATHKVEHTPICFSRNSSLSSLSVNSDDDEEDDPNELALLEDCISSALPPRTRSTRSVGGGGGSGRSSAASGRISAGSGVLRSQSGDELERMARGHHESRLSNWRQQAHRSSDNIQMTHKSPEDVFLKPAVDARGRPCRRSRSQDSENKYKDYGDQPYITHDPRHRGSFDSLQGQGNIVSYQGHHQRSSQGGAQRSNQGQRMMMIPGQGQRMIPVQGQNMRSQGQGHNIRSQGQGHNVPIARVQGHPHNQYAAVQHQQQQIISESKNLTHQVMQMTRSAEKGEVMIDSREMDRSMKSSKTESPASDCNNFFMMCSGNTEISVESISKMSFPSSMAHDSDDDILDDSMVGSFRNEADGQYMAHSGDRTLTEPGRSLNSTLNTSGSGNGGVGSGGPSRSTGVGVSMGMANTHDMVNHQMHGHQHHGGGGERHWRGGPGMEMSLTSEDGRALAENANIVVSEMLMNQMVISGTSTVDEDRFIEHETLSLVSNDYTSDTASEASNHWSEGREGCSGRTEGNGQSGRPRIVKPGAGGVVEATQRAVVGAESTAKAVRGKRKPLYSNNTTKSPVAPANLSGQSRGRGAGADVSGSKGHSFNNSGSANNTISPRTVPGSASANTSSNTSGSSQSTGNTSRKSHTLRTMPQASSTPVKSGTPTQRNSMSSPVKASPQHRSSSVEYNSRTSRGGNNTSAGNRSSSSNRSGSATRTGSANRTGSATRTGSSMSNNTQNMSGQSRQSRTSGHKISPKSKNEAKDSLMKPKPNLSKQGTFIKDSTTNKNAPVISPTDKMKDLAPVFGVKMRQKKGSESSAGNRNSSGSSKSNFSNTSNNSNSFSTTSSDSPPDSWSKTLNSYNFMSEKEAIASKRGKNSITTPTARKNLMKDGHLSKIPSPSRGGVGVVAAGSGGKSKNSRKSGVVGGGKPLGVVKSSSGSSLVKGGNSSLIKTGSSGSLKQTGSRPTTPVIMNNRKASTGSDSTQNEGKKANGKKTVASKISGLWKSEKAEKGNKSKTEKKGGSKLPVAKGGKGKGKKTDNVDKTVKRELSPKPSANRNTYILNESTSDGLSKSSTYDKLNATNDKINVPNHDGRSMCGSQSSGSTTNVGAGTMMMKSGSGSGYNSDFVEPQGGKHQIFDDDGLNKTCRDLSEYEVGVEYDLEEAWASNVEKSIEVMSRSIEENRNKIDSFYDDFVDTSKMDLTNSPGNRLSKSGSMSEIEMEFGRVHSGTWTKKKSHNEFNVLPNADETSRTLPLKKRSESLNFSTHMNVSHVEFDDNGQEVWIRRNDKLRASDITMSKKKKSFKGSSGFLNVVSKMFGGGSKKTEKEKSASVGDKSVSSKSFSVVEKEKKGGKKEKEGKLNKSEMKMNKSEVKLSKSEQKQEAKLLKAEQKAESKQSKIDAKLNKSELKALKKEAGRLNKGSKGRVSTDSECLHSSTSSLKKSAEDLIDIDKSDDDDDDVFCAQNMSSSYTIPSKQTGSQVSKNSEGSRSEKHATSRSECSETENQTTNPNQKIQNQTSEMTMTSYNAIPSSNTRNNPTSFNSSSQMCSDSASNDNTFTSNSDQNHIDDSPSAYNSDGDLLVNNSVIERSNSNQSQNQPDHSNPNQAKVERSNQKQSMSKERSNQKQSKSERSNPNQSQSQNQPERSGQNQSMVERSGQNQSAIDYSIQNHSTDNNSSCSNTINSNSKQDQSNSNSSSSKSTGNNSSSNNSGSNAVSSKPDASSSSSSNSKSTSNTSIQGSPTQQHLTKTEMLLARRQAQLNSSHEQSNSSASSSEDGGNETEDSTGQKKKCIITTV